MKASLPLLLLAVVIAAATVTWVLRHRGIRRQQAVARLLDAADALETRLRSARAELEAVTGNDAATRDALQEMLRQRLWLQGHGATASLERLDSVRVSLDAARQRIEQQLSRIETARGTPAA